MGDHTSHPVCGKALFTHDFIGTRVLIALTRCTLRSALRGT